MNRYPPDIHGLDVEYWIDSASVDITWNHNAVDSSEVIIDIITLDLNESTVRMEECLATFEKISNTGMHNLGIDGNAIFSSSK